MYGFSEFIPLTEEEILKRVSQEDIVKMVIGYEPIPYQRMTSPIRPWDHAPGAWFEWWNGKLMFQDFADSPTHRVPIKFVADYYNLTFGEAMRFINDHFELGLGDKTGSVIPKPVVEYQFKEKQQKQRHQIIFKPRPFTGRDKAYWTQYEITKDNLVEDDVVAGIWYKLWSNKHSRWVVIRPNDVMYVYTGFEGRVKCYRPHYKDQKFATNCHENDIGGLKNLNLLGKLLIVAKSYKDYRVLKNQGCNVIWFQNEACEPKDEILIDLCERFDEIAVFFDNDATGIKMAIKIAQIINDLYPGKAYPIYLPEELLQEKIKDPSDLIHRKKRQALVNFLKEKNLYGRDTSNHPQELA